MSSVIRIVCSYYDNADDVSILEGHLPTCPLHILVTTRRSSFHSLRLQHAHALALEPLQPGIAVQLLLTLCNHHQSLEQLQREFPSEYKNALNVVGPAMLDGLPLGVVHAAGMLNKQLPHKPDRLKELSETLQKNRGHLSMEPRSLEEWLRNYHLSGIQRKLENELNVGSLDDICSLTERTIMESSMTHQEKIALQDAREDLLHCPAIGPWKIDIDAVCRDNKVCKPLLQAASLFVATCSAILELIHSSLLLSGTLQSLHHLLFLPELANLGFHCMGQRKYKEVEKFLEKALNVKQKCCPAQHPSIISCECALCDVDIG